MPGSPDQERRRLWKAAFLLFIAGLSQAGREAVAARIPVPTDPPASLSEAEIESIINRFMPSVLGELSLSFVSRLNEALDFLDRFESAASQLTIVGQDACLNDRRARLSKLQVIYLGTLIENFQKPVAHAHFRELGIQAPTSMKHGLIPKLATAGIDVQIATPSRSKADTLVRVRSTSTQ